MITTLHSITLSSTLLNPVTTLCFGGPETLDFGNETGATKSAVDTEMTQSQSSLVWYESQKWKKIRIQPTPG